MYLKLSGSYLNAHLVPVQAYIRETIPVTNATSDRILCENLDMTGLRNLRASNENRALNPETIEIHRNIMDTRPVVGEK